MFSSFPSKADGISAAAEKASAWSKDDFRRAFSEACTISCRLSPAGKGYGRRQHHFLAGKMQYHSDLTLLCCLQQLTVIVSCALSSICRSFPPFREMFIAEVFKGIFRFLSVRPQNLQLCCRLPICPVILLPEQTSSGFVKLPDSPSSSSVTVRCKYEYA